MIEIFTKKNFTNNGKLVIIKIVIFILGMNSVSKINKYFYYKIFSQGEIRK